MRLLSFFNDIERTLLADDPEPDSGVWHNTRMVNVPAGLARLNLASGPAEGPPQPKGAIQLQAHNLADGTFCLKARLSWRGSDNTVTKSVFTKPGINWRLAAAEIAATWMAGAPASLADSAETENLAAAV